MLERQPDEIQDLLLRTCLLARVNPELANGSWRLGRAR
jgi:hypothetical protein